MNLRQNDTLFIVTRKQGLPPPSSSIELEFQKFNITLKFGSQVVKILVTPSETIKDLKDIISEKFKISPQLQKLLLQGRVLQNDESKLKDYLITGTSTITLIKQTIYSNNNSVTLFVDFDGEYLRVDVPQLSTIKDVKQIIADKTGKQVSKISLSYNGMVLQNEIGVGFYKIPQGAILKYGPRIIPDTPTDPNQSIFKITVKTLTGSSFQVNIMPEESILEMKLQIELITGISIDEQILMIKEKILDDLLTVEKSGLNDGMEIALVFRMMNGTRKYFKVAD